MVETGGSCRKLKVDELIIRWYSDNHSHTVNGIKDEEIKRRLRNLAMEEADHDINMSENCFDKHEDESSSHRSSDDELSQSLADRSHKTTAEDFVVILEKIKSIEDKLERKIEDIALDVCKLKEANNLKLSLTHEYICRIKEENPQLKAENVSLKERVDYTTFAMSDLNTK